MSRKPIRRSHAKAAGLKMYFTGKECQRGHIAERYVSTGQCSVCISERTRKQVEAGYFRDHYARHADARRQKMRDAYPSRKDDANRRVKEWGENNPEKRRIISMAYKARRRAQESGGITTADLAAWISEQSKVCHWCGVDCNEAFHVDHVMPLARGGKHESENLVIACPRCNLSKSAKDPEEFAAEVARHIVNPAMLNG